MSKIHLFLILFVFKSQALSYFDSTKPSENHVREMNGIFFDQYKNFPTEWKLVTVRYREDSKELRFTYANEVAFKALDSIKPEYPDGAILGKVSFIVEDDPAFSSSKVPSVSKRYQLMIKDKSKYKDTDGWGYALFDREGVIYNEDLKVKTASCVACHRLVPERDYVFSRKIGLKIDSFVSATPKNFMREEIIKFENLKKSKVPKQMKKLINRFDYIKTLKGPLQENAFSGTLDEMIPFLSQQSKSTSTPASLIIDENNFSLVIPLGDLCPQVNNGEMMHVVLVFNSKEVRNAKICL